MGKYSSASRRHGYSQKGQRCGGLFDWNSKDRTNVIGALFGKRLLTLSFFTTTITATVFNAWVIQDLIPKLPEKSVVVMDNATFHKSETMQKALENAGHTLLYMPSYSPDLNPIEKKWAQAKSMRRNLQCDLETLFKNCLKL